MALNPELVKLNEALKAGTISAKDYANRYSQISLGRDANADYLEGLSGTPTNPTPTQTNQPVQTNPTTPQFQAPKAIEIPEFQYNGPQFTAPELPDYNDYSGDISRYLEGLTEAQKSQYLESASNAYQQQLAALQGEREAAQPVFAQQRSQARAENLKAARSFNEYLAMRGLATGGAAAQGQLASQVVGQQAQSAIQAQEGQYMADIGRRESAAGMDYASQQRQADYQSQLASMQAKLDELNARRQMEMERANMQYQGQLAQEQARTSQSYNIAQQRYSAQLEAALANAQNYYARQNMYIENEMQNALRAGDHNRAMELERQAMDLRTQAERDLMKLEQDYRTSQMQDEMDWKASQAELDRQAELELKQTPTTHYSYNYSSGGGGSNSGLSKEEEEEQANIYDANVWAEAVKIEATRNIENAKKMLRDPESRSLANKYLGREQFMALERYVNSVDQRQRSGGYEPEF